MAVGVLLLTHVSLGRELLHAAQCIMPHTKLNTRSLSVAADEDMSTLGPVLRQQLETLDHGDGVLILSDLYGATPSNMALEMHRQGAHVACVSGANLPMLLRIYNYADKPLAELAGIAASGGRRGVTLNHA